MSDGVSHHSARQRARAKSSNVVITARGRSGFRGASQDPEVTLTSCVLAQLISVTSR
jgi:hypothetical protein